MADIFGGSTRYANRGTSGTYKKTSSSGSSKSSGSSSSSKISSSGSSKSSSGSSGSSSGVKYNSSGQRLYSDGYGGWTTMSSTSQDYAKNYGSSSKTVSSGGSSATKPSSGGSSSGSSVQYSSGGGGGSSGASSPNTGSNYHQDAIDAAARGDWAAVAKALAARQAKINADGRGDRGTSNAQIFANLQNQYKSSYNALPSSVKNTLNMAAGGQLNGRGWEDGHDYLSEAQALAKAGDLDAAYDALTRRGFKMYDTGSTGGGTTQDQAYAAVRQLYNESVNARNNYLNEVARNAERLAAHPTQFGNVQNAALANKHFVSQDGQYIIYYDSTGTPVKAQPNNGQYGSTKYSPEYIELMRQYYGGDANTDYASLQRQMHNLDVVHSGNGRLVNNDGSYASGSPIGATSWYNWDPSTIPGTELNVNQDKAAIQDILNRINAGQTIDSAAVPLASSPTGTTILNRTAGSTQGGYRAPVYTGGSGYAPDDAISDYGDNTLNYSGGLTDWIRAMYQANLEAQLAQLQASFEQNRADIQAQDDLIAQSYQNQRNQAAGQNDLARLSMLESAAASGINTGASGQLALANSMAYQNALAQLGAAENQDLSANALALNKLSSSYRGAVDSATAANTASMSQAMLDELIRQINAETAAQQAALAQSNWERQFAYQQAQDALAQQNWQAQFDYGRQQDAANLDYQLQKLLADQEAAQYKSDYSAYNDALDSASGWAKLMLQNGVMPDASTLELIGLDPTAAQSLANSYRTQLANKYKSGSSSSGGGGGSKTGGSLTYSQAKALLEDGVDTPEIRNAFIRVAGQGAYDQLYGGGSDTGNQNGAGSVISGAPARSADYAAALKQAISQKNAGVRDEAIADYLDQYTLTPYEVDYIMTQVKR